MAGGTGLTFAAKTKAIIIAVSAALVFASLVVVPQLATDASQAGGDKARRIVVFDPQYDYEKQMEIMDVHPVKIGDLQPNESPWFLSPFSKDMNEFYEQEIDKASQEDVREFFAKSEAYSRYNLIRLPEFLGGDNDDISSFRAYSAMAVSNSCGNKYFSTRYAIEDPCHGDMYRPWDGLAVSGPAASGVYSHSLVESPRPVALPYLTLAVDEEGYIVAKRPDPTINGVVGQGHRPSQSELESNNREMLAAASAYAGYALPFPPSVNESGPWTLEPADVPWYFGNEERAKHLKATYYHTGVKEYGMIEIKAYLVDYFPDLIQGGSPDHPLNMTSLLAIQYWPDGRADRLNVSGQHPAYVSMSEDGRAGAAAILGKSADGTRELVVTVQATVANALSRDRMSQIIESLNLT
jgi:hypothetical protein